MKTQLKKIVYNGLDERGRANMSFLWDVICRAGEAPDTEYILLCRPLESHELAAPPALCPGDESERFLLHCLTTHVEKSAQKKLSGLDGRPCAFAICPLVGGVPCAEAVSNTVICYVGERKRVFCSLQPVEDGCSRLTVRSECAIAPQELDLLVDGVPCPLPFTVGPAKQEVLFLTQLSPTALRLVLKGDAKYKCNCIWEE